MDVLPFDLGRPEREQFAQPPQRATRAETNTVGDAMEHVLAFARGLAGLTDQLRPPQSEIERPARQRIAGFLAIGGLLAIGFGADRAQTWFGFRGGRGLREQEEQ